MRTIAEKIRRALRNNKGVRLSSDEVEELAIHGFVKEFAKLEVEELCREKRVLTSVTPIGSISVETADPHTGKLQSRAAGDVLEPDTA